jgi:hypothetical protein
MNNTVIRMSVQRMICTGCGAEANASCNCGVSYVTKSVRAAEAIKANPNKSDGIIAAELGIDRTTVLKARKGVTDSHPDDERLGRDGKSYSIRQRITDDPDIPQGLAEQAAATMRRRVFLRCASDAVRKAKQGAGLRDAKGSEIDLEILMSIREVCDAWRELHDEVYARTGHLR